MALADLIASLRVDLADPDKALFADDALSRCVLKAAFAVARDLGVSLAVSAGEITPEPTGESLEMLLLMAQIHACQFMRAVTARGFSFSSGDKRVDKSKQPEHWAKLEEDLKAQYRERLREIKPDAAVDPDDYVFTPGRISPVLYEQGADAE